jgi:hypothetical protein
MMQHALNNQAAKYAPISNAPAWRIMLARRASRNIKCAWNHAGKNRVVPTSVGLEVAVKNLLKIIAVVAVASSSMETSAVAAEQSRKLSGAQIRAKFAGMQLTDEVHFRDVYDRDGTRARNRESAATGSPIPWRTPCWAHAGSIPSSAAPVPVRAFEVQHYKNSFNWDDKSNPYLPAISAPPFDMYGNNTPNAANPEKRQNQMGG